MAPVHPERGPVLPRRRREHSPLHPKGEHLEQGTATTELTPLQKVVADFIQTNGPSDHQRQLTGWLDDQYYELTIWPARSEPETATSD